MDFIISIDIWSTILSYLKYTDIESANTNQLIAIMKMSFVNKSLRNLITFNSFWVLYNSIEYKDAEYDIYNCNEIFCRIVHKIRILKTQKNIRNLCSHGYVPSTSVIGCTFGIICRFDQWSLGKFELSNEEIVPTYVVCNKKFRAIDDLQCSRLVENKYCILFQGIKDGHKTNFYIKKNMISCCIFNNVVDLYNNACDLCTDFQCDNDNNYRNNDNNYVSHFDYETGAVLHNNYIWTTKKISMADNINHVKINFYAQNVMTNIKYLIHQIEEIQDTIFNKCVFDI